MQLRLHTRAQNSAGERVRIVLNLKRIAYEYVAIPSLGSPEYRRINPQGLMPALEIDGVFVAQSMAIIELLEELFPKPSIFPVDPMDRARARAFALHIAADLHPINNNRVRKFLATEMGLADDKVSAWYQHWIATTLTSLEADLARRPQVHPFCFGETPSIADACLVPQLANARRFGSDLSSYPLLVAIDARCQGLAAFRDAAPANQPDYRPPSWVLSP
jgi:maleylacetoacetate isomerase